MQNFISRGERLCEKNPNIFMNWHGTESLLNIDRKQGKLRKILAFLLRTKRRKSESYGKVGQGRGNLMTMVDQRNMGWGLTCVMVDTIAD